MVGSLEFAIHEVVTARNQTLEKDLICAERAPGKSGMIKIIADERQGMNNEEMSFKLSSRFSDNSGMNFFFINKFLSPGNYKPIYKSEIMAAQNGVFSWKTCSALTSEMCNEDPDREIKIEFYKS